MSYEKKRKLIIRIVAGVCAFLLIGSVFVSVIFLKI